MFFSFSKKSYLNRGYHLKEPKIQIFIKNKEIFMSTVPCFLLEMLSISALEYITILYSNENQWFVNYFR